MGDVCSPDFPATTPELEGELALHWAEPPSLIVLSGPVDLRVRLVNIGQRPLDILRARDAAIVLLALGDDSVAADARGFSALGVEARMRPGDSADLLAHAHFGHDGTSRGHPPAGSHLVVAHLQVGVLQGNGWKYGGGVVVTQPERIALRLFPGRDGEL